MPKARFQTNWNEVFSWLNRAQESLKAAQTMLDKGWYSQTISRAYYVMFYAAFAAILSQGKTATLKTHSGLISKFSQELIKTKKLPQTLGRELTSALDLRIRADYEARTEFHYREAQRQLKTAEKFLNKATQFINQQKPGKDR